MRSSVKDGLLCVVIFVAMSMNYNFTSLTTDQFHLKIILL